MNMAYGKHRAHVLDNKDPEKRGRLMVACPSLYPQAPTTVPQNGNWNDPTQVQFQFPAIGWCDPVLPYADFMIPPIFTASGKKEMGVWLEFEGGDPAYPLWTGVWYSRTAGVRAALTGTGGDAAYTSNNTPYARIIDTESCRITLDDTPNAVKVLIETNSCSFLLDSAAGEVKLMNSAGSIDLNSSGQFALTGAGGVELLSALNTLMQDVQTAVCVDSSPLTMPTFTTDLAKLASIMQ